MLLKVRETVPLWGRERERNGLQMITFINLVTWSYVFCFLKLENYNERERERQMVALKTL